MGAFLIEVGVTFLSQHITQLFFAGTGTGAETGAGVGVGAIVVDIFGREVA